LIFYYYKFNPMLRFNF